MVQSARVAGAQDKCAHYIADSGWQSLVNERCSVCATSRGAMLPPLLLPNALHAGPPVSAHSRLRYGRGDPMHCSEPSHVSSCPSLWLPVSSVAVFV